MATIQASISLRDGVSGPLRNIQVRVNQVQQSFQRINRTSPFNTSQFNQAASSVNRINRAVDNAAAQMNRFGRNIQNSSFFADGLAKKFESILSSIIFIQSVVRGLQALISLSDTASSTTARLNMIVDDGGSVEALENKIKASAQRARASYQTTADAVAQMGLMAGDAFANNDELIAFTETLNKVFATTGAGTQQIESAMLQLTQSMASGVLRGEELNSVFENAQPVVQAIADYLGVSVGEIRNLASEGALTADVVKSALLDEDFINKINSQFESMPLTWAQAWVQMKDRAIQSLQPVLDKLKEFINSEQAQTLINRLMGLFDLLASALNVVLGVAINVVNFFVEHWSLVEPVIWGLIASIVVLNANMIVTFANLVKDIALKTAEVAVTFAQQIATFALTVAQQGLNAALYACPITWIIAAIIALIASFYLAVAVINKFAGTSVSATGIIMGTFATMGAFVANSVIIPLQNIFASTSNFIGNVFNDPIAAIKVAFYDMCLTVLGYLTSIAQGIEDLINGIPGVQVSLTGALDSLYSTVESKRQAVKANSGYKEYFTKWDYLDYSNSFKTGYNAGTSLVSKIKGLTNVSTPTYDTSGYTGLANASLANTNLANTLDDINNNTGNTAAETAKVANAVSSSSSEELKYLREIAERQAINQFTTAEVKLDFSANANINSDLDVDGFIKQFEVKIEEAMLTAAEGVHV